MWTSLRTSRTQDEVRPNTSDLCRVGGAIARVTSEGELEVITRPSGQPDRALLYGREFLEYRAFETSVPSPSRFAMAFGASGSAGAPNALLQTSQSLPSSARPGGKGVLRESVPMLRTASAADKASKALQERAAAQTMRVVARCFLLPTILSWRRGRRDCSLPV